MSETELKAFRLLYLIRMVTDNSDITLPLQIKKLRFAKLKLVTIMWLVRGELELKPETTWHEYLVPFLFVPFHLIPSSFL